ncbi:MAG: DUF1501 domain-containing protein [Planctomycetia bacterium]|nr:DUF1501 domain-containing protein [Planctomycetia bacterium]
MHFSLSNQAAPNHRGCADFRRVSRRQAMQVGVFGALGLTLSDLLRLEAAEPAGSGAFTQAAGSQKKSSAKALSVIQLNLGGGFPHHESFDPKPEAPAEYRGPFGVVKTKGGEIFSDKFPKTSAIADRLTVVRSVVGRIPDHALATYHLFTGYTPTTVIDYPQMASIVSHELGPRGELPPYIAIPSKGPFDGGTGFLSSTFGPFEINADAAQPKFKVRDFSTGGLAPERFQRRLGARDIVQGRLRDLEADATTLDTMDGFYKQACTLLTSEAAQKAFTLDGETEETFQLYGRDVPGLIGPDLRYHPKGLAQRLILARRLVEAGTRFVTLSYGGWDSHVDLTKNCLDQMPALDHAIAGLIEDLDRRGMLDTTLFWLTSEFGRTPKINQTSGRDHWARCYSMLLAGGGFTRGQIYGASDSTGAEPARDAVPLEDLMFTIYHQLGIDADKELVAFGTRPIEIIKDGKLVKGLLA